MRRSPGASRQVASEGRARREAIKARALEVIVQAGAGGLLARELHEELCGRWPIVGIRTDALREARDRDGWLRSEGAATSYRWKATDAGRAHHEATKPARKAA